VQLFRKLRLGATLNRWLNGYNQHLTRPTAQNRITEQDTDVAFKGWNGNFGVIFSPVESLNLAAVAKTKFTADVTLSRSRTDTSADGVPATNQYTSPYVTIDFPGSVGAGVSWRPSSPWTLSLDYTRTFWSNGKIHNFFTLPRNPNPGETPPQPQPPDDVFDVLPFPSLNDADQQDTEQIRAGGEYVVILGRLKLPVRAGYVSDRQYFRGADGTAPRFDGVSVGTGVIAGSFLFDVAYLREHGNYDSFDNASGAAVSTSVTSNRLYVSLIYRHRR
jgi:long-subunit fatty acid transport protein